MQIALGRKGDYALRAVLDLARAGGQRRKAREIAEAMDIPARYLPQVVAPLVQSGVLTATAGPDGGYALARAAERLSLLEVVETVEGPLVPDVCVLQGGPCDWEYACPVHETWTRANRAFAAELRATTFADLAAADEALQRGEVPRPGLPLHIVAVPRRGVRPALPPRERPDSGALADLEALEEPGG